MISTTTSPNDERTDILGLRVRACDADALLLRAFYWLTSGRLGRLLCCSSESFYHGYFFILCMDWRQQASKREIIGNEIWEEGKGDRSEKNRSPNAMLPLLLYIFVIDSSCYLSSTTI